MKNRILQKIILLFIVISQIAIAKDNNISIKIPSDVLFSIDNKFYTENDFPKEYKNLSLDEQKEFVGRFIYYKIFLKTMKDKEKEYAKKIKNALIKEKQEMMRKGIVLNKLDEVLFNKKVTANTIIYNEVIKKHKNIDSEIKEFYIKHKEGYKLPMRAEVSHIVLKDINQSKKFIKELRENNNSIKLFAKIAKKYSLDRKSKNNGGYVGNIGVTGMGKDFFDSVWKTKEGNIVSKPLKYNDYYHIVYVFKKYREEQRTLKDERDSIEKFLLKKEMSIWKNKHYFKNKKNTKVKFYNIDIP